MKHKKNKLISWLVVLWLPFLLTNAFATIDVTSQIKTVSYQPDQIVMLKGTHFIATSIQFSKQEKISGVYMGDQVAWTYAMNPSTPYLLFVKPTLDKSDTNMTVITNQHVYHFHLISNINKSDDMPVYSLKFDYQKDNHKSSKLKMKKENTIHFHHHKNLMVNKNYTLKGSSSLFPKSVYDDGTFTYFEFPDQAEIPAIFRSEEGHEKLINSESHHNVVIAKCVAKVFILQKNDEKAWVENRNKKVR